MNPAKTRVEVTFRSEFRFSCKDFFPLLCPVKEDEWIPGWAEQRTIIYSKSGGAELGCVFLTTGQPHLMGPATWTNNVYNPYEEIQYSAVNEHLVYQIHFVLQARPYGCSVLLRRLWTALTPDAKTFLGVLESKSQNNPPNLFEMADFYLRTGKMISVSD